MSDQPDNQSEYERLLAGLNPQYQEFVRAYLDSLNATQAAREARYQGQHATTGWRLLRHSEIAPVIAAGLAEKAMARDEVLARVAEIARGDMREFILFHPNGELWVDLSPEKPLHLIRKLKVTKTTRNGEGDDCLIDTKVEIELHDPQRALETLAKHHKIVSGEQGGVMLNVTPEQLAQMSDQELDELARKRGML